MTSSVPSALPDDHRQHNRLLVVRGAVEKLDSADRSAAEALLERCAECRELADDARALRTELAALPAPARARDFRLSSADAERLRGGLRERLLGALGSPSLGVLQPLAGAAMAVGLALIVLTSIPMGGLGAGGGGAAPEAGAGQAAQPALGSPGPSAATGAGGAGGTPAASDEPRSNVYGQTDGSRASSGPGAGGAEIATDQSARTARDAGSPTGPDWRLVGLFLLVAGAALLIVRRFARREASDPLLR